MIFLPRHNRGNPGSFLNPEAGEREMSFPYNAADQGDAASGMDLCEVALDPGDRTKAKARRRIRPVLLEMLGFEYFVAVCVGLCFRELGGPCLHVRREAACRYTGSKKIR